MAPKNTLNAQNLEALGAERLAELLMEISSGDAAVKRRLRLALACARSPADASREIRKRLAAISRSSAFINWQKRRALVDDLETQRRAIVDHVGPADPKEALDLMWSFTGLAASVFARCTTVAERSSGFFTRAQKTSLAWPRPRVVTQWSWRTAHIRRCSPTTMDNTTISSPR
jgi:hypothetical protein